MTTLRFRGALGALSAADRALLVDRGLSTADETVRVRAAAILARVRAEGDAALFAMAKEFDGATLSSLEVPRARWSEALERLDPKVRRALERAARNIATAHAAQKPTGLETEIEPGIVVGRRADPLARVGVYAPGGRAVYPSSVLMGVVPAKVAGVGEVIVCSPPNAEGQLSAGVLAAAAIAGADRVFALGGAGAIAALAYGTQSVPRVDRIVGPGNAYVAAAKQLVTDRVAIDSPAGPSELLAIADRFADPAAVAREMIAQSEHDPDACCVALVEEPLLADVARETMRLCAAAVRKPVVEASLASRGAVLSWTSLDEAIVFNDAFAPEHLLLALRSPEEALARVRNAGTIFVGAYASVAHGDYLTGGNHVLPTAGLARAYSGLSLADFYRWTTYQRVTRDGAAAMADDVEALASNEGLFGHAAAAAAWRKS